MAQSHRQRHAVFTPGFGLPAALPWNPPVDVYHVEGGWLLKFELAGVGPDDMTVAVEGRRVVVRGSRLDRCLEPGCAVHQLEITYTRFERAVELPESLERAAVRCEFHHGMVLVRVYHDTPRETPDE
jgi:HSP20 family protein